MRCSRALEFLIQFAVPKIKCMLLMSSVASKEKQQTVSVSAFVLTCYLDNETSGGLACTLELLFRAMFVEDPFLARAGSGVLRLDDNET